jgi:hypothetical protein
VLSFRVSCSAKVGFDRAADFLAFMFAASFDLVANLMTSKVFPFVDFLLCHEELLLLLRVVYLIAFYLDFGLAADTGLFNHFFASSALPVSMTNLSTLMKATRQILSTQIITSRDRLRTGCPLPSKQFLNPLVATRAVNHPTGVPLARLALATMADLVALMRATVQWLVAGSSAAVLLLPTEHGLLLGRAEAADLLLDLAGFAGACVALTLTVVHAAVEQLAADLVALEG